MTIDVAALVWAKADRRADDRMAEVDRIEREIVLATDQNAPKEQREALAADRDGTVLAFRAACEFEAKAQAELFEAARELLDKTECE